MPIVVTFSLTGDPNLNVSPGLDRTQVSLDVRHIRWSGDPPIDEIIGSAILRTF